MLIPTLRDEKKGLGVWLLSNEKSIPKTRRSSSSKGKSSLLQSSPGSSKGESVADCYDQTSLVEFASSEDPAMVNAVKTPSASKNSGHFGAMQRTETRYRQRDHVPMRSGKDHVTASATRTKQAGDSSREKGGTQKFLDDSLTI